MATSVHLRTVHHHHLDVAVPTILGYFGVEATDGGSRSDIPSWAKDTGNELLEATADDGVFRYYIKKG